MNFEVIDDIEKDHQGNEIVVKKAVFHKLLDPEIMKSLLDITNNEKFYDEQYAVSIQSLFRYYDEIFRRVESGNESLIQLAFFLSEHFKDKLDRYDKMSKDGKITFDNLSKIFKLGDRFVAYTTNNQIVGSVVHDAKLQQTMFGNIFVVTGLFTVSNGKEFIQVPKEFVINQFGGLQSVENLPVRPMNEGEYSFLTKRGEVFAKYGLGTHYLAYEGEMFRSSMYGEVHFNATGRLMIDALGFKTINPNYERYNHESKNVCNPIIPDELKYMTWPFLQGFSFISKTWGEIYVDNLREIKYDDNAFDYLVLDLEIKEMVKALITNIKSGFSDIINGKSGGCIFLLQGPPGVGKTLSCEAVAELLHKPLYSITVGELGITPDTLEKKLLTILEIANSWDAIILIDEADIFLEKRTINDITRNAMVGIFLRLLERHQGILFLTTNRAETLDEAFRSRISVIIQYNNLNQNSRNQIWQNLLRAANVKIEDDIINNLSNIKTHDGKDINGRQIKNAIRMAQCLAFDKKETVNSMHLEKAIKMM